LERSGLVRRLPEEAQDLSFFACLWIFPARVSRCEAGRVRIRQLRRAIVREVATVLWLCVENDEVLWK